MKNKNSECCPQDRCPRCGEFAVGYGSRRLKNNSKIMPADSARGDFLFLCPNCKARLTLVSELLHNAEAPAASISG